MFLLHVVDLALHPIGFSLLELFHITINDLLYRFHSTQRYSVSMQIKVDEGLILRQNVDIHLLVSLRNIVVKASHIFEFR